MAKDTLVVRAQVLRAFLSRPGAVVTNAHLQDILWMPRFPKREDRSIAGWQEQFAAASRARDRLNHTLQYLRTARILDRGEVGWCLRDEAGATRLLQELGAQGIEPVSPCKLVVLPGGKA